MQWQTIQLVERQRLISMFSKSLYDFDGIVIVGGTVLQILRHEERLRIHANWNGEYSQFIDETMFWWHIVTRPTHATTPSWAVEPENVLTPPEPFSHRWQYVDWRAYDLLMVDEASMLLPRTIALTSLLNGEDGKLMVAGDNAQLDPIMRYSWKTEDRPPIVEFVPF